MAPIEDISSTHPELLSKERYYISSSSKTSSYLLPADEEEAERLNAQSQAIIELFDSKLVWVPITLQDGNIVLDSGTGSGHWLLSLVKELKNNASGLNIQLMGIDITPRMFPPLPSTPPNTTFIVKSITSLPAFWTSTISLIHQRLLMVALQSSQWHSALSEMYRVLKPGGWIQLFEPNHHFISPLPEIVNHRALQLRNKLSLEIRHVTLDIVDHLPEWLARYGFINLKIEKKGLPMGSWAEPVMEEGKGFGLVKSGEEYDQVIEEFEKLCEETPGTYFEYWVFTAQKP
ncbi:hypothetical protein AN958_10009 [Leucoagaricus sp. SymC.cos]|nr:hypothetical protein AN958_10009 [Leucoagaricus sp. SymC.cos]